MSGASWMYHFTLVHYVFFINYSQKIFLGHNKLQSIETVHVSSIHNLLKAVLLFLSNHSTSDHLIPNSHRSSHAAAVRLHHGVTLCFMRHVPMGFSRSCWFQFWQAMIRSGLDSLLETKWVHVFTYSFIWLVQQRYHDHCIWHWYWTQRKVSTTSKVLIEAKLSMQW